MTSFFPNVNNSVNEFRHISTERRLRDEHIIDKNCRTGYPLVMYKLRINALDLAKSCKIRINHFLRHSKQDLDSLYD